MKCFECGKPAEYDHHVVPRTRGGTKTVPLCGKCHSKAHHKKKNMSVSQLTREALKRRRRSGKRVSRTPYGYDLGEDGETLVKNSEEQKIIRKISLMRDKGFSFPQIAQELTASGFATKRGNTIWDQSTVRGIIMRNKKENG